MLKFDKHNNVLYISCDSCGNDLEFEADSLMSGVIQLKDDGWVFIKSHNKNLTFCCDFYKDTYTQMARLTDE